MKSEKNEKNTIAFNESIKPYLFDSSSKNMSKFQRVMSQDDPNAALLFSKISFDIFVAKCKYFLSLYDLNYMSQ